MRFPLLLIFLLTSMVLFAQRQNKLVPDFGVLQLSGSIGQVSAGFGYSIFKSRARVSTHFGIVTERNGSTLSIVSAKLYFKPATFTVWNRVRMNPFDIGVTSSYSYGRNFGGNRREGDRSSESYWWNNTFRVHLGMESSLTYEFKKGHCLNAVTGFVEFNTNELYFVSFARDIHKVTLWDVVMIGTGARVYF